MIKRHEGLKLTPYRCTAGRLTVGYGHNLDAHGEAPETITQQQAEKYLDEDIAEARKQCEQRLIGWDQLGEVRRAVLIDMCFNLGIAGLLKFARMRHWIAKGYYGQAAVEMRDSVWAIQVQNRARELATMMEKGEWI